MANEKTNTLITYGYTDASNYKATTSFVIEGCLGVDGAATIMRSCKNAGTYLEFVPEAIGLPLERPGEYNEQDDHPWASFSINPELNFQPTDLAPTSTLTVSDILLKFILAKDEWDRLAKTQDTINNGTVMPNNKSANTTPGIENAPELTAFDDLMDVLNKSETIAPHVKSVVKERMKGIRRLIAYGMVQQQ